MNQLCEPKSDLDLTICCDATKFDGDVWNVSTSPAFSPVLRKPNRYQNHIQFVENWIMSKLTRGNAYVLKERDQRDSTRSDAPLAQAPDAVYLDSTPLSLDEVEDAILRIVRGRVTNGKDYS